MDTVTKSKNEGYVGTGKRLVEWKRKNKADLLKNKGQMNSSDEPSVQVPTSSKSSQAYKYGGGDVIAVTVRYSFFGTVTLHPRRNLQCNNNPKMNVYNKENNRIFGIRSNIRFPEGCYRLCQRKEGHGIFCRKEYGHSRRC